MDNANGEAAKSDGQIAQGDTQIQGFKSWAEVNGVGALGAVPTMPGAWFEAKYPALRERFGQAVLLGFPPAKDDEPVTPFVKDLGEDFLAATMGELGTPRAPTVFLGSEGRFYTYEPDRGIFDEVREAKLVARLSELLLHCAADCAEECDTTNLEFRFRDTAHLRAWPSARVDCWRCRPAILKLTCRNTSPVGMACCGWPTRSYCRLRPATADAIN